MEIYWSFKPIQQVLAGIKPEALLFDLGAEELRYYRQIRFAKRRHEWLAGRYALKRLLSTVYDEYMNMDYRDLQLIKTETGAACLEVNGSIRTDTRISLSHSNGYVYCACAAMGNHLGVDLELVEERASALTQDFFTRNEVAQLEKSPVQERSFWTTLIWSSKEAVLKALLTGLKVDTRSIDVDLSSSMPADKGWNSIRFTTTLTTEKSLRLYWRREDKFVLTICTDLSQTTGLVQV